MKRLLALFLLPAMAWGQAGILTAPYVVPDRRADYGPDAFLLQPKMAQAVYKDSVLWLTAESPVLNEGTTGAQWICYAKTCSGNAVQTDTGRQPARVFTNGAWALSFDGTDDHLNLGSSLINNGFSFVAQVAMQSNETYRTILDNGGNASGGTGVNFRVENSGRLRIQSQSQVINVLSPVGTRYDDGARHVVAATWDGTTTANAVKLYANGVQVAQGTAANAGPYTPVGIMRVGAWNSVTGTLVAGFRFNGLIYDAKIFPRQLSLAEIQELSR
jgi:hypothetical protein